MKICKGCKENKESYEFCKESRVRDGLQAKCRKCVNERARLKASALSPKKTPLPIDLKRCSKCSIIKHINEFGKSNGKPISKCKECANSDSKIRRLKNPQKCREIDKKSYRNRKIKKSQLPEIKAYQKEYSTKNRRKITKQQSQRLNEDPTLKLSKNLRNRLLQAIKGEYRSGSAVDDLGCTIKELKIHIESLFYPHPITNEPMTWENWGRLSGKWQIDHIMALLNFDLTDRTQFLKASHYTNLQPLWFEDHVRKTATDFISRDGR
jgi:hypothetical protein